ncbi:MAG: GntR family transcriptional regulator [Roseobacter sp.]
MEVKQADKIADAIEELVFSGHFENGQRLDETRLAQQFGVSRTPVREALQRLVSAQLAMQRPRRGVFVVQPGSKTLVEMFETMAEIEGVCGQLVAERITQDGLAELRALNALCISCVENNDCADYSRHNENFHHALYRLSGNAFMEKEALRLYRRLKPFRRVQLRADGRMAQSVQEHIALITSLEARDAGEARRILRHHVGQQGEEFYARMEQLNRAPTTTSPQEATG